MKILNPPSVQINNRNLAGQLASKKVLFGERSRYAVYAIHTRFEHIQWIVADVENSDDYGFPVIIRQNSSFIGAIKGL